MDDRGLEADRGDGRRTGGGRRPAVISRRRPSSPGGSCAAAGPPSARPPDLPRPLRRLRPRGRRASSPPRSRRARSLTPRSLPLPAGVVRLPEAHPPRPQRLRLGRRRLVGRPVCSVRLVGQDAPPVGPQHGPHDPSLRRPHVGRPLGLVLGGQPPDRLGLARPHHQAVEHARGVQVQHYRGRAQRVGVVRALLA